MQELLNKRSYNAKHFDRGDGSFVLEAHAGHVHYKDGEEFKQIDWTLIFDEIKRGWGFNTHSFHPFFPEYSDGWAEFHDLFQDKDQIVKYKPIGSKVKGELIPGDLYNPNFDDNDDNKGVIYRDVFGAGRDYILYNTRSSMVKVATVNNPNECTADAVFEWEVEFPDKELFRVDKKEDAEDMTRLKTKTNTEDGKLVGYKLEKRDGKNLNTNKLTLIGNSNLDGKEWYTYLKSFKAWDSEGKTIEIVTRISFVNGKAILKKTIPLEFLQNAVGRVFTDTTTSYYASPDDSVYSSSNVSWADCRSATTGNLRGGNTLYVFANLNSPTYNIERMFLTIDTSAIPDTDVISAATLYLYGNSKAGTQERSYRVYDSSHTSTPVAGDFDLAGSTQWSTGDVTHTNWPTSAYTSWELNSTGLAGINKTGSTKLSLREYTYDVSNTAPSNQIVYPGAASSETTGTSQDPYLSVTYSAGGGSTWTPKIIIF